VSAEPVDDEHYRYLLARDRFYPRVDLEAAMRRRQARPEAFLRKREDDVQLARESTKEKRSDLENDTTQMEVRPSVMLVQSDAAA